MTAAMSFLLPPFLAIAAISLTSWPVPLAALAGFAAAILIGKPINRLIQRRQG